MTRSFAQIVVSQRWIEYNCAPIGRQACSWPGMAPGASWASAAARVVACAPALEAAAAAAIRPPSAQTSALRHEAPAAGFVAPAAGSSTLPATGSADGGAQSGESSSVGATCVPRISLLSLRLSQADGAFWRDAGTPALARTDAWALIVTFCNRWVRPAAGGLASAAARCARAGSLVCFDTLLLPPQHYMLNRRFARPAIFGYLSNISHT